MDGAGTTRFCSQCNKTVTDLSAMAPCEAEAFLADLDARRGSLAEVTACVRFRRDGAGRRIHRVATAALGAGMAAGVAAGLAGCAVHHPAAEAVAASARLAPCGPQGACFTVVDEYGLPMPGALLTLSDRAGKMLAQREADDNGHAVFGSLPDGDLRWLAEMQGFGPVKGDVTVSAEPAMIEVEMKAGQMGVIVVSPMGGQ